MESSCRYEQVLESVGAMGLWQFWVIFCISVSQFFQSMNNMAMVFMQITPPFHCSSGPKNSSVYNPEDRCFYTNESILSLNDSISRFKCQEWTYDRSGMRETVVTQWDLVCDRMFRVADVQLVFMIGIFVGSLFSGFFSDRFGRKKVIVMCGTLTATFGVLQAHSSSFVIFLICRFLLALTNTACFQTGYVLCMEITTSKYRDWIGGFFFIPYALGYTSLAGVAYLLRDWRDMHTAISLPVLLNLLYWWLLPESPRWLLSRGMLEEARTTLCQAAKINGRLPLDKSLETDHVALDSEEAEMDVPRFQLLLKYKTLALRCVIICFVWCR